MPGRGEKLEELPEPVLPGSEQFRLQHSRAIEICAELPGEWAFLQHAGILDKPSLSCAPAPTAAPSMAAVSAKSVNRLRIVVTTIGLTLFAVKDVAGQSVEVTLGSKLVLRGCT